MWYRTNKLLSVILAGLCWVSCFGQSADKPSTQMAGKSPLDELPAYIKQVTYFGERADWSHDGKRILFLEKTFGDAFEVELATGIIRPMTHHYFHEGYTRALYLSNGDILLSGARRFDANDPWPSRDEKNAELWVLKKDLSSAPVPLGEKCSEGPAVSRKNMRIAWTQGGAFYMADIVLRQAQDGEQRRTIYKEGRPELANPSTSSGWDGEQSRIHKKKILDKKDLPFKCDIETQNFRPPDEKELVFSAYGYQGTEVMGLNLETGKITNYSLAPNGSTGSPSKSRAKSRDQYDEPEGIFPDGKYTLVECDKHNPKGTQYIDIYKLALDGTGKTERLTNFSDYSFDGELRTVEPPGYKASNPVVSDDGRYMAFQVAKKGDAAGVGRGILIFDLQMYERMKQPASSEK